MKDSERAIGIETSRGLLYLEEQDIFRYLPDDVIDRGFETARATARALKQADNIYAREDLSSEGKRREIHALIEYLREGGDREMVTIKKIAQEAGMNEGTTRNRITKAIERGVLTRWERQGGTILVDREEGRKIAEAVGEPIARKIGRPPKKV